MSYSILQLPSALTGRTSSSACRRLSLHTPSFYSRTSTNSCNVSVPNFPEHEQRYWGPEKTLPHNPTYTPQPNYYLHLQQEEVDLKCVFQGLQSFVESNFKDIKTKLCHLEDRVAKVEGKQGDLMRSPSISSFDSGQCDGCKRRSPTELQVCIPHFYILYSTLFDNPSLVRKSEPVFMYALLLQPWPVLPCFVTVPFEHP